MRRTSVTMATILAGMWLASSPCAQTPILTELIRLQTPDPLPYASFGWAVDVEGDWLAVSSLESSTQAGGAGAAYVYQWDGSEWHLDAELRHQQASHPDFHGYSMSLSGNTLLVGVPFEGPPVWSGAAIVYVRDGKRWIEQQQLEASDAQEEARFGWLVALDGDTAVIARPGKLYVFERVGTLWSETASFVPLSSGSGLNGGLAFRGDIVAKGNPYAGPPSGAGVVTVFVKNGNTWIQEAVLRPDDIEYDDQFGTSVAVDGERIVVGSPGDIASRGAAYVFERVDGSWTQVQKLTASDAYFYARFGTAVSMDGNRMAVSALDGGLSGVGRGYVFRSDDGPWFEESRLRATVAQPADLLGNTIAVHGDRVVMGAHADSPSGSAFVFHPLQPSESFCAGDGSASACPCGNASAPGAGEGCANSTGNGGRLASTGSHSASADDLVLAAMQLPAGAPVLLFVGDERIAAGAGAPFGDGLRCVGVNIVRLGVDAADTGGAATWGPGLRSLGGWQPGDVRHFQAWYRDPVGGPCAQAFNLTQGWTAYFSQ